MTKLLVGGGGLLSTILSVFGCTPEPKGAPLIVQAVGQGAVCNVRVNNEQVTSERLSEIASSGTYSWGIVRLKGDVPYKCVGATIIMLQRAGFTTVKTEISPLP